MSLQSCMTVAVGALGLVWGPLVASAQVSYREVALEGMTMPGLNGAEAWQFGPAKINSAGDVAFETVLQGAVDVTNDESIWVATDEQLRLIAREGDAWPGAGAGLVLGAIQPFYNINRPGYVSFRARVAGAGVTSQNDLATWGGAYDSWRIVAREGDPGPGTTRTITNLDNWHQMNSAGEIAFLAQTTFTVGSGSGVWSGGAGTLRPVVLNGEPAPGTPPGTTFSAGGIVGTQGNDGAFTFFSGLSGGGSASPNNRGLWTGTAEGLRLVVRGGDAAPGTTGSFAQFQGLQGAGGGRIAFGAALAGAGVDATNDGGMWVEDGAGNTSLAWRKGDAAPGTDARLRSLREVFVNAEGRQAFAADVSGSGVNATNDEGVWFGDRGGYALVARKGHAAPGVNDGSTFASLTIMGVNALGQVAISGRLAGDEVGSGNDYGIWLSDESGQLRLVAREGGVIDVGNGESRQIMDLQMFLPGLFERSGGDDGNPQVLNDAGQLAFTAVTTDGAGVFVAMVPEPGFGVALGAAGLVFWRGRCRR